MLHRGAGPLLMPNPWDIGSARLLESLGFLALATTSGGFAASLGRPDGAVSRDEAIAHGRAVASAVDVPVSADLENCFADDPDGVAATIALALEAGLAGCSVEDFSKNDSNPIYDLGLARDRVAAAAEVAHRGPVHLVLTARAENLIRGRPDLDDTIARLQAYQEAGADVLYVRAWSSSTTSVASSRRGPAGQCARSARRPHRLSEPAEVGVARYSVASAFAWVALAGLVERRKSSRLGTY